MLNDTFRSPIGKFLIILGLIIAFFLGMTVFGLIPTWLGVVTIAPLVFVLTWTARQLAPRQDL